MGRWVWVFIAVGCAEPEPESLGDCTDTCRVVVDDCALPSWPDRQSCVDACVAGAASGADVESQKLCVELAECDLFALVECEHAFGPR